VFLIVDDRGGCGPTMRKNCVGVTYFGRFWLTVGRGDAARSVRCEPFAAAAAARWYKAVSRPPAASFDYCWKDLMDPSSAEWVTPESRAYTATILPSDNCALRNTVSCSVIFVLPTIHEFSLRQLCLVDAIITMRRKRLWTANVNSF